MKIRECSIFLEWEGLIYLNEFVLIDSTCLPSTVFGLIHNVMLAPSVITLVEAEVRDLTVGYIKGQPSVFSFNVVASGGGGNASKLHTPARCL